MLLPGREKVKQIKEPNLDITDIRKAGVIESIKRRVIENGV